jgi:hypothetical protein
VLRDLNAYGQVELFGELERLIQIRDPKLRPIYCQPISPLLLIPGYLIAASREEGADPSVRDPDFRSVTRRTPRKHLPPSIGTCRLQPARFYSTRALDRPMPAHERTWSRQPLTDQRRGTFERLVELDQYQSGIAFRGALCPRNARRRCDVPGVVIEARLDDVISRRCSRSPPTKRWRSSRGRRRMRSSSCSKPSWRRSTGNGRGMWQLPEPAAPSTGSWTRPGSARRAGRLWWVSGGRSWHSGAAGDRRSAPPCRPGRAGRRVALGAHRGANARPAHRLGATRVSFRPASVEAGDTCGDSGSSLHSRSVPAGVVSLMPASWNQIASWLEQVDGLRQAACVLAGRCGNPYSSCGRQRPAVSR